MDPEVKNFLNFQPFTHKFDSVIIMKKKNTTIFIFTSIHTNILWAARRRLLVGFTQDYPFCPDPITGQTFRPRPPTFRDLIQTLHFKLFRIRTGQKMFLSRWVKGALSWRHHQTKYIQKLNTRKLIALASKLCTMYEIYDDNNRLYIYSHCYKGLWRRSSLRAGNWSLPCSHQSLSMYVCPQPQS